MQHIKHKSGQTELQRKVCLKCDAFYPTLNALKLCGSSLVITGDEEEALDLDGGDEKEADAAAQDVIGDNN